MNYDTSKVPILELQVLVLVYTRMCARGALATYCASISRLKRRLATRMMH